MYPTFNYTLSSQLLCHEKSVTHKHKTLPFMFVEHHPFGRNPQPLAPLSNLVLLPVLVWPLGDSLFTDCNNKCFEVRSSLECGLLCQLNKWLGQRDYSRANCSVTGCSMPLLSCATTLIQQHDIAMVTTIE